MYDYMYTYLCVYRLCCAESGCVVDISPATTGSIFVHRNRCVHYFTSLYTIRNVWSTTRKLNLSPACGYNPDLTNQGPALRPVLSV